MKQNALTILSPVDPAGVEKLDQFLTGLGDNVAKQTVIPFGQLDLLHFASWIIIRSEKFGPQLVFESNFDGEAKAFLDQLVKRARGSLDQIYHFCPDYPRGAGPEAIRDYLLDHKVYTDTFYVGCVGMSRQRIRAEEDLRRRIEEFLDTITSKGHNAAQTRQQIQNFVRSDKALEWALQPPEGPSLWERIRFWAPLIGVVAALAAFLIWLCATYSGTGLLVLLAALVVIFTILYGVLRWKEMRDSALVATPGSPHLRKLRHREDHRPQNHLTTLTDRKPGLFRFALLKAVLAVINLAARYIENKGKLGGISSIHFARWAVVNRGKRLLFLSNFDGSWEHYLGEFIDLAARGLTAVWSNVVNFPKAWGLIHGGARDEQKFKASARSSEVFTQLWYSAYPFLSVTNILNNAAIRDGLWRPMDNNEELEAWLRRF